MAGLFAAAQQLIHAVTTDANNGWAVPMLFSVTNGSTTIAKTINGIPAQHHFAVDEYGKIVDSKTARVSISVLALEAVSYPVRNTRNEISLANHRVTWTDISGIQATYIIRRCFPNGMTGSIVCELGDYRTDTPPGKLIISWAPAMIPIEIVETPDGSMQTLDNGDEIPKQYAPNEDGTLTIPYMVGKSLLTPFMLDGGYIQDMGYTMAAGKLDKSNYGGGFSPGSTLELNASIPVYQ